MIGKQLQALGTSIDFAPVADTNTNPDNPVINRRSFGQYPELVATHAQAYACGLAQAGVMSCAKHFLGHGDTSVDSHLGLPVINHDAQRIQLIELAPFKYLIDKEIPSIMIGHLLVPAYDASAPATLSYTITTDFLKKECGFNGLVITDGLNMQGVTDIEKPGDIEVKVLQAGADLLLIPADVDKAFACIKNAILAKHIAQEELDERVLKIIRAKNKYKQTGTHSPALITDFLNNKEAQDLSRLLYQKAITIIRNDNTIPLTTDNNSLAVISIGLMADCPFVQTLRATQQVTHCPLAQHPSEQDLAAALAATDNTRTIIIGLAGLSYVPKTNYGIAQQTEELIERIHASGKTCILVLFGNPYALSLFKEMPTLVEAYEDHSYAQQAAAEVLLGTIQAEGRLPIGI